MWSPVFHTSYSSPTAGQPFTIKVNKLISSYTHFLFPASLNHMVKQHHLDVLNKIQTDLNNYAL